MQDKWVVGTPGAPASTDSARYKAALRKLDGFMRILWMIQTRKARISIGII